MKASIRATDVLAKVCGDEFVIVFNKGINQCSMTQMLNELIRQPINFNAEEVTITASIGYAAFPKDGTAMDELMDTADKRMYQSKHCH